MKRHQRSRGLTLLTQLLMIASTASAVSLQDFQIVTVFQIPSIKCLRAYSSRIDGCSRGDFKDGARCSESCVNGVLQEQASVVEECGRFEVNAKSLIGLALLGQLLEALCPGSGAQTTTVFTTVQPSTSTSSLTPSQTQETTTMMTSTTSTSTEETSTTTTTSSTSSSSKTTSAIATSTSTSTTESSESSTTTQSTSRENDTTTTFASATSTETEDATTATSTSSAPSPTQTEENDDNGGNDDESPPNQGSSGGGSPFDVAFGGGSEKALHTNGGLLAGLTGTLITAYFMGL